MDSLQEIHLSDLFANSLVTLAQENHPYIQVNVDDKGTICCLGEETRGSGIEGSKVTFTPFTTYRHRIDLNALKDNLHKRNNFYCTLNQSKLTIEFKSPVEFSERLKFDGSEYLGKSLDLQNDLMDSLSHVKRSVVCVKKQRHFVIPALNAKATCDTIPIGKYNITECFIAQNMGYKQEPTTVYANGEYFISINWIESLDRSMFDVFLLVDNEERMIFEIINRPLYF